MRENDEIELLESKGKVLVKQAGFTFFTVKTREKKKLEIMRVL